MTTQLDFLLHQAISYINTNNFESGILLLKQIVKAQPRHSEALRLMAVIHAQQGTYELALELINQAISVDKKNGIAFSNKGNILYSSGCFEKAIESYKTAIKLSPLYAEGYSNLGNGLQALGEYKVAVENYRKAIQIDSSNPIFYCNLGNALLKLAAYHDASTAFNEGVVLQPNNIELLLGLAKSQIELKDYERALSTLDKILILNPHHAGALSNIGVIHFRNCNYEDAISSSELALRYDPRLADAWSNKGAALELLGFYDEALLAYSAAIEVDENLVSAHHNLAFLNLYRCKFDCGWEGYKWRWKLADNPSKELVTTRPYWDGKPFAGTLFVWAEQGIGDQVLFSSSLNDLAEHTQKIIVSVDKKLLPIFQRSFPSYQFIERDTALPEESYDYHIPIGGLGQFFRTKESDFSVSKTPYLIANSELTSKFDSLNQSKQRKICGLSWKSKNLSFGEHKSMELMRLSPILESNLFHFINLQYGDISFEKNLVNKELQVRINEIEDLDLFENIDGMLSAIKICDVVLTTSNSTAHLAGSIGKETLLFLPHSLGKFWYWHDLENISLWYPTIRIFKQNKPGDWTDPINQALAYLEDRFAN